jgi:hypothetical protein
VSKESEIKRLLREIIGDSGMPFIHAEVVSVDSETCTVKRNGLQFTDVRLGAVVNENINNLLIVPKVGSMVLIADMSAGQMRDLVIIGWSEVDTITINGGEFGGLVKIQELTSKLNALVTAFNSHTHTVATTGTAAAQSGTAAAITSQAAEFSKGDYENEKIKH